MMYREIIAVCSQIHTKHINTLCGLNVELLHVKAGGTYSDHWILRGSRPTQVYKVTTHKGITNRIQVLANFFPLWERNGAIANRPFRGYV